MVGPTAWTDFYRRPALLTTIPHDVTSRSMAAQLNLDKCDCCVTEAGKVPKYGTNWGMQMNTNSKQLVGYQGISLFTTDGMPLDLVRAIHDLRDVDGKRIKCRKLVQDTEIPGMTFVVDDIIKVGQGSADLMLSSHGLLCPDEELDLSVMQEHALCTGPMWVDCDVFPPDDDDTEFEIPLTTIDDVPVSWLWGSLDNYALNPFHELSKRQLTRAAQFAILDLTVDEVPQLPCFVQLAPLLIEAFQLDAMTEPTHSSRCEMRCWAGVWQWMLNRALGESSPSIPCFN